jgi:hypothetical protein
MISILLATTGRPDMAQAFAESLAATTVGHDIELVAAVDNCPETVRRLGALEQEGGFRLVVDYCETYRGSSRAWNDALASSTGDKVVLAADDLEFQPGWLDAALEQLAEFPDGWGFVGFNDGHWGPELSTHYLMSRRFVADVLGGVVAWESYRHSFNDREANARAREAGRYAWCENARVLHRHWIFGDRPQDSTDTRLLAEHGESQRRFDERQAAGWPDERRTHAEV